MNEFLTFALSKNVIFDQIGLFTSYLSGKRAVDASEYAKVASLEPDRPLLVIIAEGAAARLAAELGEMLASFEVDGDIIRYVLRNPVFESPEGESPATAAINPTKVDSSKTVSDSTIVAAEPDHSVIYRLLESYVMAATIVDWLRIVDYEFAEGPTSALKSAESMATSKLTLLRSVLTPAPVVPRPHKTKASPRRISPI